MKAVFLKAAWPWMVLATMAGSAVWHVVDFSEAADTEFPKIARPFHNPRPPAAYRLAEPGDTLDRIGLYASAAALALSLAAVGSRRGGDFALWPSALGLSVAATWHASTPGPSPDGWHGLGWRAIFDRSAPVPTRAALLIAAVGLAAIVAGNLATGWRPRAELMARGRGARMVGLLIVAAALVACRQGEIPRVEPLGYWPRCAFALGMSAFAMALIRARPFLGGPARIKVGAALAWGLTVAAGVGVATYHRPLARLKAVVPGRIYISAMPTYRGLTIEQDRLHFRTIINLFDEASTQASPRHGDEIRFVREHGLRYLGSPSDGMESDRFLDETLALAQDPDAWPILVHCHGCMDRSPAWMGIYRFLVEGKPLASALAEIERHRGSRPKALVSLQYNRKLPPRAPDRFADDPTGRQLLLNASTTVDPFRDPRWNATATGRKVVTRIEPTRR